MRLRTEPDTKDFQELSWFSQLLTSPLFHSHWCQSTYSRKIPVKPGLDVDVLYALSITNFRAFTSLVNIVLLNCIFSIQKT